MRACLLSKGESMEGKRYYWLKLKADFFASKEIKKLRKAGGDDCVLIYLKMQLASIQTDGCLSLDGIEDTAGAEIALELDEDPERVELTLSLLGKLGLAEVSDEAVTLPKVAESIGTETMDAGRKRAERAAIPDNVQTGADNVRTMSENVRKMSGQSPTEKEIEIDNRDREYKREKDKREKAPAARPSALASLIEAATESEAEREALRDFAEMRKTIKAPLTPSALKGIIEKVHKLGGDEETRIAILKQSIINSWRGVFPLHEDGGGGSRDRPPAKQSTSGQLDDFYRMSARWAQEGGA